MKKLSLLILAWSMILSVSAQVNEHSDRRLTITIGSLNPLIQKDQESAKKIDVSRLKVFRILFYTDLIKRKPNLEAFIVGWIRRAMEA